MVRRKFAGWDDVGGVQGGQLALVTRLSLGWGTWRRPPAFNCSGAWYRRVTSAAGGLESGHDTVLLIDTEKDAEDRPRHKGCLVCLALWPICSAVITGTA